jgi:CHAT domain-containing protein/Tfp pilus assembly protein PilF
LLALLLAFGGLVAGLIEMGTAAEPPVQGSSKNGASQSAENTPAPDERSKKRDEWEQLKRQAAALCAQGEYNKTAPVVLQARELCRLLFGENGPEYAASLLPGARKLISVPGRFSWSPDGTKIVCLKSPPQSGLQILDVRSGAGTDLVPFGKDPAWSAAGNRIAFVREIPGKGADGEEIWLMGADGGNPRRLCDGGFPSWSSDGKTIFFHSRKRKKIMAVEPDVAGSVPQGLFAMPWYYFPAVAPDGKRITFIKDGRLIVVDREARTVLAICSLPGWRGALPGWSPDGKYLAIGSYAYTNRVGLWILDLPTGHLFPVASGPCTLASWSADGSKFSWCYRDVGQEEVWTVEASAPEFLRSRGAWSQRERIARPTNIKAPELLSGKLKPQDQRPFYEAIEAEVETDQLIATHQTAKAVAGLQKIVEVKQRVFGPDDPELADSLDRLAGLYKSMREHAKAEPYLRQACEIRKKVLGENHPGYAASLNSLANLYEAQGDYPRAEPLYRQALEIQRKIRGENHPLYAAALSNLAHLYQDQGDYLRAEPLLRQVMEIKKKVLGENHPGYAASLHSLALLYVCQGDFPRAEPLYRQALEIEKKVLGGNHPDYALSLHNLALLYMHQDDYLRAEPLLRQAAEIWKRALGENNRQYATSLNSLALLYEYQADYLRAEPLLRQALAIRKKVMGENHPDYATSLHNLALLYQRRGDYSLSEPLLRQATEIWKKAQGENHPDYALGLHNLALLYQNQGDYLRAERLLRQAMGIRKNVLGENHPLYANSLDNLADLYRAQGDYARAEPLYCQALEIEKKVLGENHHAYAESLSTLALLYEAQGDHPRAEPLLRQAASITRRQLEATAVIQSERQQLAMLQSGRSYLNNYLKLAVASGRYSASAYRELLAWKGMVLRRNRLARAATQTPELAATFTRLQRVATQLTHLAWATPEPRQEANWRQQVARLSAEKEQLEADLSARSADYRQAKRQVTLEEVQAALPRETVLVDFVESSLLVGFVVAPGRPVEMVVLGPTRPIDEAIRTWRVTFGMSAEGAGAARLLRERLWAPIEEKLRGAKIVLISPDGALSRLPFGALPGKTPGTYLIEERTFAVVPVPQLIPQLVQEEGRKQLRKKLLLLGNVDYDALPAKAPDTTRGIAAGSADDNADELRDERLVASSRSVPPGSLHFDPLPGTEGEICAIEELYRRAVGAEGVTALRKSQAGKDAFLAAARRHGYLHLATHGFFIEQEVRVPASASREASRFGEMLHGPEAGAAYPALLSGLALAGANRTAEQVALANSPLQEQQPSPPAPLPKREGSQETVNDGILTAEEIGTQNLDGVEVVVLSACESGLGKQAAGEGVLGLQRSFQSAGARTVVASLWPVDDAATKALMVAFYANLWQKKLPKREALRQAQLTMLREYDPKAGKLRGPGAEQPVDPAKLAAAQEAGGAKSLSPFYWASFVLSGDWK